MTYEPTAAEIAWQLARMDEGANEANARAVLIKAQDKVHYRCPECGGRDSLYMRADIRWNFNRQAWVHVDGSEEDYGVDCTECDWTGPLGECEAEEDTEA